MRARKTLKEGQEKQEDRIILAQTFRDLARIFRDMSSFILPDSKGNPPESIKVIIQGLDSGKKVTISCAELTHLSPDFVKNLLSLSIVPKGG